MLIIKKRWIRSLNNNLPGDLRGGVVNIAVKLESNENVAQKIGFGKNPKIGDTLTPKPVGPATRFNAHGREKILRNREKEKLYRTQEWTREEWAGRGQTRTVTSLVDIPYYRYPREHIDGFDLELTIREFNGQKHIVLTEGIRWDDGSTEKLITAINIFLEVFGQAEILNESLEEIPSPAEIRRLNWIVLPKGEKITQESLDEILSKSRRIRPVQMLRQERISSFNPDIRAIGMGGFTGYVVYVFKKKGIAVMESVKYGNASYIIAADNWEKLSKMTKQQLLSKSLVQSRETHTKKWFARIKKLLA
ncbi:MAG: hypothetical protein WD467_02790 [Candidatus Saccharimonadales bacterium]